MMESGRCIINGTDVSTLGMFIERGGSNDFLSFPDRRTPEFNDWAEYDGLDVDLTDLSFDAKKVIVNYVLIAPDETVFKQRLNSFETLHKTSDYLSVYVAEFNKTFQLRFTGFSKYEQKRGFTTPGKKIARLSVDYMMDDPLQVYTTSVNVPVSSRVMNSHVSINSYDLSRFGIVVRDIYSTSMIPRSGKPVLERKFESLSGLIADTYKPKAKPRRIEIKCTMLAENVAELMTNLSVLWSHMNSDNPTLLHTGGRDMSCYYSKMTNFTKDAAFRRKVQVSFSLHFQEISLPVPSLRVAQQRIDYAERSAQEHENLEKKTRIGQVMVDHGFDVSIEPRYAGVPTSDALVDGQTADFKRCTSANRIIHYTKDCWTARNSKVVVFEIGYNPGDYGYPSFMQQMAELATGCRVYYYFTGEEDVLYGS